MKNTLFIIAAYAFAAVSCQKESAVENEIKSEGIITVTADIAQFGGDTKTSINGSAATPKPLWSTGDEIKLFDTVGNSAIYVLKSGEEGKSSATFELKSGQTALSGTFACAYYPAANATAYATGTGITATIPATQAYTAANSVDTGTNAGTFASGAAPMVGTGTLNAETGNLGLTFKNVFGILQLNFTGDGSTTINQIDLVSTENLSGTATITIDGDGTPTCTIFEGEKYVTLAGVNQTMAKEVTKAFYITVPVGTISRVYVTTNNGIFWSGVKSIGIIRSNIKSMNATVLSDKFTLLTYSEAASLTPTVIFGTVWAPVNCGYDATNYPYGKLYQWGRHDGCGYGATWTDLSLQTVAAEYVKQDLAQGPIAAGNENASCFYTNSTFSQDWLSTQNNYRWSSATGDNDPSKTTQVTPIKTGYDPCPTGWRVPTYYELEQLKNAQMSTAFSTGDGTIKGHHFGTDGNNIFLPAAGRRYYDGDTDYRSQAGAYWSSSVDVIYALYLSFGDGRALTVGYSRAVGNSVRCVQE